MQPWCWAHRSHPAQQLTTVNFSAVLPLPTHRVVWQLASPGGHWHWPLMQVAPSSQQAALWPLPHKGCSFGQTHCPPVQSVPFGQMDLHHACDP
jgi:hypothetical protein